MRLSNVLLPVRAALIVERGRMRHARERAAANRHAIVSSLLIFLGMGGALAGGALIGEWAVGLVLIAESTGVLYFGLFRDDGKPAPVKFAAGPMTHEQILERARAQR